MTSLFDLAGRHALVTGASGGLGRRFAQVLARAGASVTVAARRPEAVAETVAMIEGNGGQAHGVLMDVTRPDEIEADLNLAEARFGPVTVLVNNAGVGLSKPLLETEVDEWDQVQNTNLRAVYVIARAVARRLVDKGLGGSVINIASIGGLRAVAGMGAYGTSKAGVVHLTQCLALEWAMHGIRVNAIAPGLFATDINTAFLASDAGEAMVQIIPQRRVGAAGDLDGPLLLLASGAGAFITCSTVVVDGGHMFA